MVRTERLELSHLAAPEPKSGVSTNFTTSAVFQTKTPGSAWRFGIWGGRWGSNPRPQEPQSCALPTELRPPYCIAYARDQMNGAPGRIRTCDHPLRRRMLYPTELRALLSAFFRSADFKLRLMKKLFKSRLTQQQAVLDKRGACYRDRPKPSTPNHKKFQLDKGVTAEIRLSAFAALPRRARMPLLFKSFPMVNQAS